MKSASFGGAFPDMGTVLIFLVGTWLAACSTHRDSSLEDGDAAIVVPDCTADTAAAQDFLRDVASAFCAGFQVCPTGMSWWSVDDCIRLNTYIRPAAYSEFSFVPFSVAPSIATERVRFRPEFASACVEWLQSRCPVDVHVLSAFERPDSPCAEVFEPGSCARGPGDECVLHVECQVGLFCDLPRGPSCRPGTCEPKRSWGEPCLWDAECQTGDLDFPICIWSSGGGYCGSGTVDSPASEGEPCFERVLDSHQIAIIPCERGLACVPTTDGSAMCVMPLSPGAPCASGEPVCTQDHHCGVATDGTMRCVPDTYARLDEPCGAVPCDPRLDLVCDAFAAVCRPAGDGSLGSLCDEIFDKCSDGLYCAPENLCTAKSGAGERCGSDQACDTNCCDRSLGLCIVP